MKRRVKAGDLPQVWMTLAERLDQFDLAWQMIRRIRRCAMQRVEQFRGDSLRLRACHPMDHAVSHGPHHRELLPRFEPVDQETRRGPVVRRVPATVALRCVPRQRRPVQSDPVHLSGYRGLRQCVGLVDRELDARRAAVDRENRSGIRCHLSQPTLERFTALETGPLRQKTMSTVHAAVRYGRWSTLSSRGISGAAGVRSTSRPPA